MININPKEYSYALRFGPFDCYKVRTGTCSLHLTDSEFQKVQIKEGRNTFHDGSVEYCRNFSKHIMSTNMLNEDTGIRAYQHKCGHVDFGDGQHRTCIARNLNLTNIIFDEFEIDEDYICRPCFFKEQELKKTRTKKIVDLLKPKPKKKGPEEFIADESFFLKP